VTSAAEPYEAPQDPYSLLIQAAYLARGHLEGDLEDIRGQIATAAEHAAVRDEQTGQAITDFMRQLEQRLEGDVEGVRGQIATAAEHAAVRDEQTGQAITDFMRQLEALELAYSRGLAKALKALRQVSETSDSRHAEITDLFSTLSTAAGAEGDKTRQQVSDVMAAVRTVMAHARETKSSVVNLEHVVTAAIGMARDQTHERIAALHTDHTAAAEGAAGRQESALEVLAQLATTAAEHTTVLGKASYDVDQLTRAVPAHVQAVIDSVKGASEQGQRTGLDIEGRITQAINGASERTNDTMQQIGTAVQQMNGALVEAAERRTQSQQVLSSITGSLGDMVAEFDAFAEQGATAADVDKVRGEVSALGELLAQTTESFEQAVSGAVDTLTVLRTAWGEETRRVLMALEEMGRVFLEKANASEHARDAAVVELGRRVARLELDRPQPAITAGS